MEIVLSEITDLETIRNTIEECDNAFTESVIELENYEELLKKIQSHGIVVRAMEDSNIAGFCAFYANDFLQKIAYISLICVAKNYQRRGIGQQLLDRTVQIAKNKGMKRIKLQVLTVDIKPIEFYKKNQFVFTGETSNNKLTMEKNI